MNIFTGRFSLEKWINHPVYLIFCFTIGFGFWTLSFDAKKIDFESVQLSSMAEGLTEVKDDENKTISRLSDKKTSGEKLTTIKRSPNSGLPEKHKKKGLPKKFKGNPAFILFEKIQILLAN